MGREVLCEDCGAKEEGDLMKERYEMMVELHKNVPPDWYFRSIKKNRWQRFWHMTRFREVRKLIEPVGGRVLDIGSADGMFTKVVLDKTKAKEVIGVDVLKKSVDWANEHWKKEKRMKFKVGDAHKLEFPAEYFEAVMMFEVVEHVVEPERVFREVKRVLKKGGYAIFLVPTDSLLFKVIWWFVTTYWWAKIWSDCHIQSYNSNNSLAKHVKKFGFEIEDDKKFLWGMLNVVKMRKK